jgi:phosphatidate cytidylyltransferase
LGGIGFYFINRKKEKAVARKSWTKFWTYFIIINVLFFSIVINPLAFRILSALVIAVGAIELVRLYQKNGFGSTWFFVVSILVYALLAFGFWRFTGAEKNLILYTFIILSIFDAFSQISGQLFGKRKIAARISPNKTIEGTVGGAAIAVLSAFFVRKLLDVGILEAMYLSAGIVLFAFIGDLVASLYKRKYNVKDYSNLIPGHGGVLDRFDSMIAGGAWVALFFM